MNFGVHAMKRRGIISLFCLAALKTMAGDATAQQDPPPAGRALSTIASLEVPRYMGTWFEIAKYPNWFQKKCASAARADYSLLADGQVQVVNRCRLADGETTEAVGKARQLGPATSAKLQVRFAPSWLSFLPFVWGDYWVIDLEQDYQLVAVSEPRRQYLWILSRTPQVEPVRYQRLLSRLHQQGFDLGRLETTPQD